MNLEQFIILAAGFLGIIAFFFELIGVLGNRQSFIKSGYRAFLSVVFLLLLDVFLLFVRLLGHNFSYRYVFKYSSLSQPFIYNLSALWAGREGSLLCFTGAIALLSIFVLLFWPWVDKKIRGYFIITAVWVFNLFVFFLAKYEDPFRKMLPMPVDGLGLQPMLHSVSMVIHPPMIYFGYACVVVAFILFTALLWADDLSGGRYLRAFRVILLAGWLALTLGNFLGMWWAYNELGWGGYWNWDPVENASLIPWLILTAILHLMKIMIRRAVWFFHFTAVLLFLFVSVIFSIYITRSSLFFSIHSFSGTHNEHLFTIITLFFLVLTSGFFAYLTILRTEKFSRFWIPSYLSKDALLFQSNIVLYIIAGSVAAGLIGPAALKLITGIELAFTPTFFSSLTFPSLIILFLLIFVGLRDYQLKKSGNYIYFVVFILVALAITIFIWPYLEGNLLAGGGIFAALAALLMTLSTFFRKVYRLRRAKREFFSEIGSSLLHGGIIIFFIGIILSSVLSTVKVFPISKGKEVFVYGSRFLLQDVKEVTYSDRTDLMTTIAARIGGRNIVFKPMRQYFRDDRHPYTQVAIQRIGFIDYYLILEDYNDPKNMIFTLHRKPFVCVIWWGGILVMLGGLLACIPGKKLVSNS